MSDSQTLSQSKQHFDLLDGLRGVAALAVVIFHFMEWAYMDISKNFIGHGFLAVDFFFCLSGFVVAYAYDDRLSSMGIWEFFKSRVIRLHPLVVLGSVFGLLAFLFDPFSSEMEGYSIGKIISVFVCSVLLIPFPVMEDRFFNLFGLNAPAWSLFWEYVANIVYATILIRLNRRFTVVLLIIAGVTLSVIGYQSGNLLGGWNGETFWHGGARIAYSFLAGLLIYRSGWIIKNQLGFFSLAILLALVFVFPTFTWNSYFEMFIVLVYFPLLVSLGAGTTLSAPWKKICSFLGNISYPLYMTHYSVIWIFGHYYSTHQLSTSQLVWMIIAGTILLLLFAYLVMRFYDTPVRRFLSQKWKKKN